MPVQVLYVRSLREQCGPRFGRLNSGDGGIPLVALQTSNVWANVVTALVLFLSPGGGLRHQDAENDGELTEVEEVFDDFGGVYCGVYEPCSRGEAAAIFTNLVNSTGTGAYVSRCSVGWVGHGGAPVESEFGAF